MQLLSLERVRRFQQTCLNLARTLPHSATVQAVVSLKSWLKSLAYIMSAKRVTKHLLMQLKMANGIPDRPSYCISVVITEEVGNDPNGGLVVDSGGVTKWGISQKAYPGLNIANLTMVDAINIYYRDYWLKINGDALPTPLDLYVLDAAVNQGLTAAIEMLQALAGVTVDGRIGYLTIQAAQRVDPKRYLARRAKRYVTTRNFDLYGDGWLIRLFKLCNR